MKWKEGYKRNMNGHEQNTSLSKTWNADKRKPKWGH